MIAAVCGALLVVGLMLDWWGYPSAFDHPEDLPGGAGFVAEGVTESGQDRDVDAFRFFDGRDLLWLAIGIAGFAWGLLVLTEVRVPRLATAALAVVTSAGAAWLLLTLVSPPDFADLGPGDQPGFDFGVDLPLNPQVGVYVALAASLGLIAAIGLGLARSGRT